MSREQMIYEQWLSQPQLAADLKEELLSIAGDDEAVKDRFYRDLEFGTGGLRGVLGAGTNRMNIYTIRRATQGLADWLNGTGLPKRVAIAHDSRINGELFSRAAAGVLAANGIEAFLYPRLEPTPALSFAVRYLGCGAGICVTASHNPAQYNGYKVYGADGCQITVEAADQILSRINALDYFADPVTMDFDEGLAAGRISWIPEACLDAFVDAVYDLRLRKDAGIADLKLVYTPLNGTGLECVRRILERMGVHQVTVVPEQEAPDGHFPTCPYPNPEIAEAMELGLALCKETGADLLLGTDPDCDRCGTAAPDAQGTYHLINGNEMGILLMDYICRMRIADGTMPARPVVVSTIVSTDMAIPVARKYGIELRRTLTGFKFIGEQIGLLEQDGEADRYLFGFEESYGYLSGSHVRDKDAVNAALLIVEMADWYRQQGKSLLDALHDLYEEYGYYRNGLYSHTFPGAAGMETMTHLMEDLRSQPPAQIAGLHVTKIVDYAPGLAGLPKANVLEFHLENGAKYMVRPSGTEPKIKIYLSATAATMETTNKILTQLTEAAKTMLAK